MGFGSAAERVLLVASAGLLVLAKEQISYGHLVSPFETPFLVYLFF